MTTLITGAGLIGSQVARLLVARGEPVVLYDLCPDLAAIATMVDPALIRIEQGDIRNGEQLEHLMRAAKVDRVVHTAALMTAGILPDIAHGVSVNVVGTATLLDLARRLGVGRFVLTSSSTVYYSTFNEPTSVPYPADFPIRIVSQHPGSFYSATKVAVEHLALVYREQFGLDVVIVRPGAVLGLWAGGDGGITGRLVRSLIAPALRGAPARIDDPMLVWRGGDEFVDARDAASGLVAALFAPEPKTRVYSIGMGVLHSFDDFVAAARAAVPGLRVEVGVNPQGGFAGFKYPRPQPADATTPRAELGWKAEYDLAAIMRDCAAFIAAG
jgi:UDP-glucose 4-epimerase